MKNTILIILGIILIVIVGVFVGSKIYDTEDEKYNTAFDNNGVTIEENIEVSLTEEVDAQKEKTTPNTLLIYKTYYTKCKHYIQRYQDIDVSLVNLTEKEFKENIRDWKVEKFSSEEIELSKEEEMFCQEHYKLKLENNAIVIYNVDENGVETEYEHTGITTEYLTNEDILKLTTGIYVYGKEELTSTIEDYE